MVPLILFQYENNSTTSRVGVRGIHRRLVSCWSWLKGLKEGLRGLRISASEREGALLPCLSMSKLYALLSRAAYKRPSDGIIDIDELVVDTEFLGNVLSQCFYSISLGSMMSSRNKGDTGLTGKMHASL